MSSAAIPSQTSEYLSTLPTEAIFTEARRRLK